MFGKLNFILYENLKHGFSGGGKFHFRFYKSQFLRYCNFKRIKVIFLSEQNQDELVVNDDQYYAVFLFIMKKLMKVIQI